MLPMQQSDGRHPESVGASNRTTKQPFPIQTIR